MNETGHRPSMSDVRSARIPWLTQRFQEYRNLQVKLLQSTPKLRGALAAAGGTLGGLSAAAPGGPASAAGAARSLLVAERPGGAEAESAAGAARGFVGGDAAPTAAPGRAPAQQGAVAPKRPRGRPRKVAASLGQMGDGPSAAAANASAAAAAAGWQQQRQQQ